MIDSELLEILACPETKEPVKLAEQSLIDDLNAKAERGELTNRAGEKVEEVRLERRDYQFLYVDGDFMTFMSLETYEQISLPKDTLGDLAKYVKESETVSMLLQEGNPLTVEPPQTVELTVSQTDPGLRGDTAQGGTKPATMETGLVVNVPLFIEEGELLRIDTKTGKYLGRG